MVESMEEAKGELDNVQPARKSMADTKKALAENSKWIRWQSCTTPEGENIEGKFLPIEGIFTEWVGKKESIIRGESRIVYEIKIADGGRERIFSATELCARVFLAVVSEKDIGKRIRLVKTGTGFNIKYAIEVLG